MGVVGSGTIQAQAIYWEVELYTYALYMVFMEGTGEEAPSHPFAIHGCKALKL